MPFSNNTNPNRMPGRIVGSPLSGLCERACIQVKKVFDACINQRSVEDFPLTLTSFTPPAPALPLTFVSGKSVSSVGIITSSTITKLPNSNLSRVQATIDIPVEVIYVDNANNDGVGTGLLNVEVDVILNVITNSLIPTTLAASVAAVLSDGVYIAENTFSVDACVTIVLKVEAEVELLIPTYGYCCIPPCTTYSDELCDGVFSTPLFPPNPR